MDRLGAGARRSSVDPVVRLTDRCVMRQFIRLTMVVGALLASGCAGSAPEPETASRPPAKTASRGVEEQQDPELVTVHKHEIVARARVSDDEAVNVASDAEPPLDPPATAPAPAPPVEERSFLIDPVESPQDPAGGSAEGPVGGGAPLDPPSAELHESSRLPTTIRLNPLRSKMSFRATDEPRIIHTPRTANPPRIPVDFGAPASGASPGGALKVPRFPAADRPAIDIPGAANIPDIRLLAPRVPKDGPRATALPADAPLAPESSPVPRTAAADLSADVPVVAPPSPVPAPRDRLVKVFYGTDRRAKGDPQEFFEWSIGWVPGLCAGFVTLLIGIGAWWWPSRRTGLALTAGLTATLAGVLILRGPLASAPPESNASERGIEFTSERGRLSVGWCEVSIPPQHDPGEVESPSILRLEFRPNPERHVVLQRVVRDEPEPFYEAVRERVQQSPSRDVFVFVHGYNVSFEDAARRTAQIAFDLKFDGAAIFFSWPSQGEIIKYTVDENNVAWSTSHLKEFLLDVVRRTDAKSVNLIAHSMGNRALGAAIRELEAELRQGDAIFDEVVLAAPDIDAGIFKRDIAPALRRTARHSTLYASTHDQALLVSKFVHGYPRAGDSGVGLVVVDGIETVDVSRIDLSLLGHSYYGSSEPILEDLSELISESRRPSQRSWLRAAERDGMKYWTFRDDLQNRRPRMSMRHP